MSPNFANGASGAKVDLDTCAPTRNTSRTATRLGGWRLGLESGTARAGLLACVGVLPGCEARICTHVTTTAGFSSLAPELDPARGAVADAHPSLVVYPFSSCPRALGRPTAKRRSPGNDRLLVHQQLLRSAAGSRAHSPPRRA